MKIVGKIIGGGSSVIAKNISDEEYGKAMIRGLEMYADKDLGVYDLFSLVSDDWEPEQQESGENTNGIT